jgi:sugar O-acyltransferase (sialic acid O-acetyltransferase NeuD family)
MKESIILIGAGGHARSCIDVIEAEGRFSIHGLLDLPGKVGTFLLGYPVIGSDEDIERLSGQCKNFVVAVGQIQSPAQRIALYERVSRCQADLPTIISPVAYVSKHAQLGAGTIVMHQVVINANATIGLNCILNTGCIVEHDAVVGDFCHISTSAVLNGGVAVGRGSFIGSNATVNEGVHVGEGIVVGANSVVVSNCESAGVFIGSPARKVEK